MNQPTRHLPGLDGLRGIAALVVVFLHGTLFVGNIRYRPDAACLAVDFFFMLSGFVIAHAYDERLAHGMTWRQFMAVRIIRLYPMLLLGTAMGAVLFIAAHLARHEAGVMATLLMAAGSFMLLPVGLAAGTVAYPVNIAAWSLFFEWLFTTVEFPHPTSHLCLIFDGFQDGGCWWQQTVCWLGVMTLMS
ncbi:MAG: acyltransferase family protein [Rhodopila sp.]